MSYKVVYSPIAKEDLKDVYHDVFSVCLDNDQTRTYINELLAKIENRNDFPNSGTPLYFNDRFTGYRYVFYKAYIIFYKTAKDEIYVDRILYAKSDYMKKLSLSEEE